MRPTISTTLSAHRHRPARVMFLAAAACAVLAAGPMELLAQSGGAPVRVKRPVRKPVIDLEREARQPRPGQVVAGEPGTEPAAPALAREESPAAADPIRPSTSTLQPTEAAPIAMTMMSEPAPMASSAIIAPGLPIVAVARSVQGPPSQVEWRTIGDAGEEARWQPISAESTLTGRIEIRTGVSGAVVVDVNGRTTLRIARLSRVRVERLAAEGREEVLVRLDRGKAEVRPRTVNELGLADVPVRILTPGAALVRRVAVEVTHDAFHGTREIMLTGE